MSEQTPTALDPSIIALANQKGGVGKTTIALELSAALVELGRKVLVVDLDPQASATRVLGIDATTAPSIADLMLSGDEGHSVSEIVRQTEWGLDLAPSEITLARIEQQRRLGDEFLLRDALAGVAGYDHIFIDCPPQLGILTVNGLIAANRLLIVTEPTFMAQQGLGDLLNTKELIRRRYNPRLALLGVIVNLFDNTREAELRVRELREYFTDGEVWEPLISRRAVIKETIGWGIPLHSAPGRIAAEVAESFTHLAGRL